MDDIVIEETFPYSIEQVWQALTDPAAIADWLMPGDFKAIVGHKLEFRCAGHGEFDGVVKVEILKVEIPRLLAYSWLGGDIKIPTVVTYTLTALPRNQTRLVLKHTGFSEDNGKFMHSLVQGGWPGKIKADLAKVLARISQKGAVHA